MSTDILQYLSAADRKSITEWASDLGPLIERNPRLQAVDLIIEGGVGTTRTLMHMMRKAFPNALYVGMDTSPMLGAGKVKAEGSISNTALQSILEANAQPTLEMEGALLQANCWDLDLIRFIAEKTHRSVPMFVQKQALNALTDRKMNLWERKQDASQILTLSNFVSFETPFIAQLHIPRDSELKDAAE